MSFTSSSCSIAKASGKVDLTDYTKSGMAKLADEWRYYRINTIDDKDIIPNNSCLIKWKDKVKKKEINHSKPKTAKEDRELTEKMFSQVDAEWNEVHKQTTSTLSPALRNVRRKGQDREEAVELEVDKIGTPRHHNVETLETKAESKKSGRDSPEEETKRMK